MNIVFDTQEKTFSIDTDVIHSCGADAHAILNRYGQTIPLAGVTFGIVLEVDGEITQQCTWPPDGAKFVKTDQDCIATYRLNWEPGQEITVTATLNSPNVDLTDSVTFTSPEPPPFEPDEELTGD